MNILSIRNLEKRYGNHIALSNVFAEVNKGDVISLIGYHGVGKSTLLRAINFLDPPTGGEVYFMGEKISNKNINLIRRKIGMVFESSRLFSHLTILENISIGPMKILNVSKMLAEDNAMRLLKSVGLAEKANLFPHQLQEGQNQRVAIARCLAMNPEVILIDEPTCTLGLTTVSAVMKVIKNIAQSDKTILIATHEIDFIKNVSNRIFYIDEKCIYEDGTPETIFENPQKLKTKEFINNICSFEYEIQSRDFDFVELYSSIDDFCFKNSIENKSLMKLHLIVEEIVANIVVPVHKACNLKIGYSKNFENFKISVSYKAEKVNALDKAEGLFSAKMIRIYATKIEHVYIDGINTIHVEI